MRDFVHPSPMPRVAVLLLGLMISLPAGAEAVRPNVQRQINEAVEAYEDLEYAQALQTIQAAQRASPTADERVTLQLYEGIFLCEMGRLDKGGEVFESALRTSPAAQLPLRAPPKVTRIFEARRTKVLNERPAQAQAARDQAARDQAARDQAAKEQAARDQAQARADAPVAPVLAPPETAAPPSPTLQTEATVEPRPLTQRWYFWAGVGVAAAAATVGGIVWARSSSFNPDALCGGPCDVIIGGRATPGLSF